MRALLPICNIFGLSDIAERYKDLIRYVWIVTFHEHESNSKTLYTGILVIQ